KFTFTITLSDDSINGTFGDMTFKNGVATIQLANGESATATGLPTGITYTIEETADDEYTVESTGATGTITEETAEASFVNHKVQPEPSPETGDKSLFALTLTMIGSIGLIVLATRKRSRSAM
ncbi:MAG: LPXTG cell wall anchor domain-containing protein, partial [Oscillospiraceae bacterium]|nr:LPXTG cell wall anchor domain-containing protein [Oscillospiraceae bacterium]